MQVRFAARTQQVIVAPVRVLEVIQRSASFLQTRGVESPRLQIEWILAHTLRIPRLQLYLQFDRLLDAATLDRIRSAVQRRGQREPLQHILGTAPFCGLELEVSRAVLVPRPETELLAEQAWTWLHLHFPPGSPKPQVLDWGTGSGCLALAVATHHPAAQITAIDISPESLAVANRNAQRLQLESRIVFIESAGTSRLPPESRFHLVVSNPPYIPSQDIASLEPEVRDHDPVLALDGGPDGLTAYRTIAHSLPRHLDPRGVLLLELGDNQAPGVSRILVEAGWIVLEVRPDHSGRERFLAAQIARS